MSSNGPRRAHSVGVWLGVILLVSVLDGGALGSSSGQESRPARHDFTVVGSDFRFSPERLTVRQNDIVRISFRAADIPHSFVIDDYRIAKRAGAGDTVVFEFRAHRAGDFRFYCNLTLDERCRQMHGDLSVTATP